MIKFAVNGITSFSVVPLRIGMLIGVITSLAAFGEIIDAGKVKSMAETGECQFHSNYTSIVAEIGTYFALYLRRKLD